MMRTGRIRTLRMSKYVVVLMAGGYLIGGLACGSSSQTGTEGSKGSEAARASVDLVAQVNETLQLRASSVVQLSLGDTPGVAVSVNLPIAGQQYILNLQPYSVRSADYQLLTQLPDGSLVEVEPGPVRTLRGTVAGVDGSLVAASLLEDGLHARILLSEGQEYWLEPIASRVPQAGQNHYVIYHNDDVIVPERTCGLDAIEQPFANRAATGQTRQAQAGACGTGECVAELAIDADYEYFLAWGSVANVEARINSVVNTVNMQYESQVDISHVISAIIVRESESDPYTFTESLQLLNQFRNHWLNNHTDITYDLAQLFTGKELNGGTIGIAWLDAVCTTVRFSVVQSDFNSSFSCATDLSAHEFGHNWGAGHCSCTSNTMNPFITCANNFHASLTIPDIIAFRDSLSCLDPGSSCASAADCDDADDCTTDTCDSGSCSNTPMDCNDTDACTTDSCSGGICSNDPVSCDDGDACTVDTCDTVTGCANTPVSCGAGEVCIDGTCVACDGDGVCDAGEDCNSCPSDCFSGSGGVCGNGVCEAGDGEDCVSCPGDCNGKQNGKPSGRFCCGDGDGQGPLPCSDGLCSSGGFACTDTPTSASCCGDAVCEGAEDASNCAIDCAVSCSVDSDCNDNDSCTSDSCTGGFCSNGPINCNDGDACTADTCDFVTGCSNAPIDCDDGDSCTADSCDPATGCENIFPDCSNVSSDNCCGPLCDSSNDVDCDPPPTCGAKHDPCVLESDCCSGDCKPNGTCR